MNPQLDNGYTKIANEILDALIGFRIPGEQRQCLDFIIRKTYGFNKLEDRISNNQFVEAPGLKKGNVSRSIKSLVDKNIVIKNDNYNTPSYRFNKKYKGWKVLSKKQPVIKDDTGVIKSDKKPLSKVMDTKERKKLLQKKTFVSDSNEFRLASLLFNEIKKRNPGHKKPDLQKWSEFIDKMIRLDKRDPQTIANVIAWCQADTGDGDNGKWKGWQNNILSTSKLRDKFDDIVLKMKPSHISPDSGDPGETMDEATWNAVMLPKTGIKYEDRNKKV